MRKRKQNRLSIPERTKRIQKTLMNRGKLTLKDYPENKDATLDKQLNNKKLRRKKVLHLDSTLPLNCLTECNIP